MSYTPCRSLLLLAVLAAACSPAGKGDASLAEAVSEDSLVHLALTPVTVDDHARFDPVPLTAEPFSDDERLGEIGRMAVDGGHLWLQDFSASPWLHLIDRGTGEYLSGIGAKGEGPGDFAWLLTLSGDGRGGIWAADGMLPRITRLTAGSPPDVERVVTFPTEAPMWTRAVRIGDRFMALGRDTLARMIVLSDSGTMIALREVPLPGPDSVPVFARLNATSNHQLCVRPSGGIMAVSYNTLGRADRFDADGNWLGRFSVPFPKPALYPGGGAAVNVEEWVINYQDCSATEQRLYLLYNGHRFIWPRDQSDSPDNSRARMIHVFDWDGKLVKVYQLDRPVSSIAVSPDDATMYAFDHNEASVVWYGLK